MKPSQVANQFFKDLNNDLVNVSKKTASYIASIGGVVSGFYQIVQTGESYDALSATIGHVSRYPAVTNDKVLVDKLEDGTSVIIGSLAKGPEAPDWFGYYDANSFQGATTGTNGSQATFVTAITITFTACAAGTYDIIAHCGGVYQHTTAAGLVDMRIRAAASNTVNGSNKAIKAHNTAATEMQLGHADKLTGLVVAEGGTITITYEYRCNTAGTTSLRNAHIEARAIRSGN